MASFAYDLRDAIRSLRRDAGYSATVILTLALTLGATTAVVSIVNGILLRPLAYEAPDRLVTLREVWQQIVARIPTLEVNEQHFEYWRRHARSFDSMAQYILLLENLTGTGEASEISVAHASSSLLDVLEVKPALGRSLQPDDEVSGRPNVALITDRFWRRRLSADRNVVGRSIQLDGKTHTVVGILPPGFELPDGARLTDDIDAIVPIRLEDDQVGWAGDHNNAAIGRLRDGATLEEARAELDVLQRQVSARATEDAREPVTLTSVVAPLARSIVGPSREGLLLLLGAVVAVLLVACFNLANLALTRATGRLRDVSIRAALGATRGRLVGRVVLEQLLLAAGGGALGVWGASLALAAFVRTAPIDLPRTHEVTLDARVLAMSAIVALAAGLLVALVPAWRVGGRDLQADLRAVSGGATSDGRSMRTRAALLTLQVAMSVTLLVVTGLLVASLARLLHTDKGFSPEHTLTVGIAMPAGRYTEPARRLDAYDRLMAGVRALPGVQAASTTSLLPMSGEGQVNFVVAEGDRRRIETAPDANFRFVAPLYFQALGMPILRGRTFEDQARAGERTPAVISLRTAATLWPGQDALGKRFGRGQSDEHGFEVVGIVGDARTTSLSGTPPLMVYVPYWWNPWSARSRTALIVRTAVEPAAVTSGVRRVVHEIDPDIAVGDVRTLTEIVDTSLAARRYQMRLFMGFGVAALVIATIGVYGVTAYAISRRRREMSIRLALGAAQADVLRLVMWQGTRPIAVGLGLGLLGAIAAGGLASSLLFEVQPRDPLIITLVACLVGAVGVTAVWIAARRGLTIDPAATLRAE